MTTEEPDEVAWWRAWALDMCGLLDRIEYVADDAAAVRELTGRRFAVAEEHGLDVRFMPGYTGRSQ